MPERPTVLFLCTANYYRSRFAEVIFNHAAERARVSWRADSAGLAFLCHARNPGVLSPYARAGLAARGISLAEPVRAPQDVTAELLGAAALAVGPGSVVLGLSYVIERVSYLAADLNLF